MSVKQFGSRSVPMFCRAWSGSKLFAKAKAGKMDCATWKPVFGHMQAVKAQISCHIKYHQFIAEFVCNILQEPIMGVTGR